MNIIFFDHLIFEFSFELLYLVDSNPDFNKIDLFSFLTVNALI